MAAWFNLFRQPFQLVIGSWGLQSKKLSYVDDQSSMFFGSSLMRRAKHIFKDLKVDLFLGKAYAKVKAALEKVSFF